MRRPARCSGRSTSSSSSAGRTSPWGLSESPLVARRSHPRQRRRAGRIDRRAQRRPTATLIWKSQARRGRATRRRCCTRSAACTQAIFFTGQRALGVDVANGRLLWSYDRVVEQHRQHRHADRARQPRVPLVRLRHRRGAARADAGGRRHHARSEVYFTREMRNHHAARCWSATTSTGSRAPSSRRCSSTPARWRGATAASARARWSTPTTGSICSARTASSAWPRPPRPATASTAASSSRPAAAHLDATRSSSNGKLFLRDQDTVWPGTMFQVRDSSGGRGTRIGIGSSFMRFMKFMRLGSTCKVRLRFPVFHLLHPVGGLPPQESR